MSLNYVCSFFGVVYGGGLVVVGSVEVCVVGICLLLN